MAGELIKAGDVLKIGQRMEFYIGEDDEKYASRIEDIEGDDLLVALPMDSHGVPVLPMRGEKIYALALGEQCRFRFFTSYKETVRLGGSLSVWRVAKPEMVEKHQNRQFVRIHVGQTIRVRLMDEDGKPEGDPLLTKSIDLSGNGVCFPSRQPFAIGTHMELVIYGIPQEGDMLEAGGHVVRCDERESSNGESVYHVGVGFEKMSQTDVNKIVRYLFAVQRKAIARGIHA